ncbi:MAG TPA: hypothetical protein VFI31_23410, partial [Pirellulales bacterium]|nr:hypothetical protein [Pirellulales bacterium]
MRNNRYWIWVLAAVCFAAEGRPLRAQTVPQPGSKGDKDSDRASGRGASVERVEPDIYYTRDKSGELVPLLNYSLEEIKKLIELKGEAASAPRAAFRLERLAAKAEAVGSDYASIAVELSVAMNGEGWVRTPLRLANLVLTELPQCLGEAEHLIELDSESREYVAWLRGKPDAVCRITLRGLVGLERD